MRKMAIIAVVSMVFAAIGCGGSFEQGEVALDQQVHQVFSEVAQNGTDFEVLRLQRARLAEQLLALEVAQGATRGIEINLSLDELQDLARQEYARRDVFPGPKLMGVVESVRASARLGLLRSVELGSIPRQLELGAVRRVNDDFVWSTVVSSIGAQALRLHFSDFALPEGAQLYVYGPRGEAFGPYGGFGPEGDGEFWTPSIEGFEAHVLVRAPAGVNSSTDSWFVIDAVGHIEPGAMEPAGPYADERYDIGTMCYGAGCVMNAGSNNPGGAQDAIAHYQFIKRPYIYMCSGGLLADSDPGTQIPYFLTANHCVSRRKVADTIEAYFHYRASGTCGDPELDGIKVGGGATLLKTSSTSDYTLLRLNNPPPSGSVFMGWSTEDVAWADGTLLFRISHPSGGPQAYSEHVVDVSVGTCQSWPRGAWIYSVDTYGATEGGSSGSPVLNAAGQVVGQLSGGCGTNVNDVCDNVNNATVDGAFANYYADVAQWLGGGSGDCADNDGDGFQDDACGGSDCDDADENVNPDASEVCDGIDNNCDGVVDEGCGGGTCLPAGDPCSSDSDCCSNKCKGKPGSRTCR